MARQAVTLRRNESIGPLSERCIPPSSPADFTGESQFAPPPRLTRGTAGCHGKALLVQQQFEGLGMPTPASCNAVWAVIDPMDAPPKRSITVPKPATRSRSLTKMARMLGAAIEEGIGDGCQEVRSDDVNGEPFASPKRQAKQRPLRSALAASAAMVGLFNVSIPSGKPEVVAETEVGQPKPSHEGRNVAMTDGADVPGSTSIVEKCTSQAGQPEAYLCPLVPALPDIHRQKPLSSATEAELRQLMRSGSPSVKVDRVAMYQQAMGYSDQLKRSQQTYAPLNPLTPGELYGNHLGEPSFQSSPTSDGSHSGESGRPTSPSVFATIDTRPIPGRSLLLEDDGCPTHSSPMPPRAPPEFIFSPFNPDFHYVRTPPELPFVLDVIADHKGVRRAVDGCGSALPSANGSPTRFGTGGRQLDEEGCWEMVVEVLHSVAPALPNSPAPFLPSDAMAEAPLGSPPVPTVPSTSPQPLRTEVGGDRSGNVQRAVKAVKAESPPEAPAPGAGFHLTVDDLSSNRGDRLVGSAEPMPRASSMRGPMKVRTSANFPEPPSASANCMSPYLGEVDLRTIVTSHPAPTAVAQAFRARVWPQGGGGIVGCKTRTPLRRGMGGNTSAESSAPSSCQVSARCRSRSSTSAFDVTDWVDQQAVDPDPFSLLPSATSAQRKGGTTVRRPSGGGSVAKPPRRGRTVPV